MRRPRILLALMVLALFTLPTGCEEDAPAVYQDGRQVKWDTFGPDGSAGSETSVPDKSGPVLDMAPPDKPGPTTDGIVPTPDGPVPTPDGPVPTPDGPVPSPDGPVPTPDGPLPTSDGPLPDIAKQCTKDLNCGKATCKQVGALCTQNDPYCLLGTCTTKPKYVPNGNCDSATGTCKTITGCKTNLDCGKPSCVHLGTMCTQTTPACMLGVCTTKITPVSGKCNSTTGICAGSSKCTKDADCGKSTCSQLGTLCQQTDPSCQYGACTIMSKFVPNGSCDSTTGKCKASSGCTKNADCGKPTCSQFGAICQQTDPVCLSGTCSTTSKYVSGGKCDSTTGKCTASPKCTKNADCGKSTCTQLGTLCQQTDPVCQSGACTSAVKLVNNGTCSSATGKCTASSGCKKDADCGKPSCMQLGTMCHQTTPSCTGGACVNKISSMANSKCDTSTGKCGASPKCTKDADCGKPTCMQLGTLCHQTSPWCLAGQCLTKTQAIPKGKCDMTKGTCVGSTACKKDVDCGNPSCLQVSTNCVQMYPTCLSGNCSVKTSTLANKKCSIVTGMCK